MSLNIEYINNNELYHKYDGQLTHQPVYVILNCIKHILTCDWDGEIGNARSFNVHYGHILRWPIAPLKANAANNLLNIIHPTCINIIEGYESYWNGRNTIARYSDSAQESIFKIFNMIDNTISDDDHIRVISAFDLFSLCSNEDLGLYSENDIDNVFNEIQSDINNFDIDLIVDLKRFLSYRLDNDIEQGIFS